MKKLRFLLFATLVAGSANAQYFQHVYGAQSQDTLQSGINTSLPAAQQGHIMAGFTDRIQLYSPMVTWTNINGTPIFNNYYRMTIAATGQQINAKARRIVQAPSVGGRVSVWGDFGTTPGGISTNFFYMLLNPNGTVSGVPMAYSFAFPVVEARATSMCTSNINPNLVYVCGYIRIQPGSPRQPVTMAINAATGAMVWGFDYTISGMDWYPTDIIESPYSSTGELALCGHFMRPGFPENGCFYRIDEVAGPGNVINPVVTYGTTTNAGGFNAIDIARNPFPTGAPGYVMGGYYNNPATGNNDSWAMKVNFNGLTVDFSTLHDYVPIAGNDDYGNDIIERLNTTGNFEYYLGGYVTNGIFGGNDDLVYKLDFTGAAFPAGFSQFTYGGIGTERVMQLDKNDPPAPNVGLSVFGNTANSFPLLGQNDFYFVKSYFNGISDTDPSVACNVDVQNHPWTPGPGIIETWNAVKPDKMNPVKLAAQPFPMQDFEICFDLGPIPGGDNSRHAAATQDAIAAPGYFPNPVSHDNAVVTVNFGKAAVEGEATIELWNAVGQLCWSKTASVTDGQTQMEIQLGNELSGGMYHLIVKQNGTVSNYRIVVQ